jgi:hypothetical protein
MPGTQLRIDKPLDQPKPSPKPSPADGAALEKKEGR